MDETMPEAFAGDPQGTLRMRWCDANPALIDALMAGTMVAVPKEPMSTASTARNGEIK